MTQLPVRPFQYAAHWLGGWGRLLLLILAVVGIIVGLRWQQQRQPPIPPNASQPEASIIGDLRQTTFRYPGSIAELRTFYQENLPGRGWRYCGTQETSGCSNMPNLMNRAVNTVDVYRRTDDTTQQGSTLELWPIESESGQVFVTLYETRGP